MDNKDIKIKIEDKDEKGGKGGEVESMSDIDNQAGELKKEAKGGFFEKGKDKFRRAREVYEQTKEMLGDKEIRHQVCKTMVGTVASVLGVKSFYDVPEYFRERFKVRGLFGKGKGLSGSVEELLSASWQMRERLKGEEAEEEKSYQVREAIKDLNERLKLTKEGSQRGSEQRKLLAKLLWENRQKEKTLKEEREAEIKKILDEYTTTKITGVQAMRQTLNTVFIASGAYTLRGLSYGFLDGVDRYLRLQKEAKRGGRQVSVLKDVIKGGITETVQAAFLKNKGEVKKTKKQKILEMTRAWGKIGRYVGIGAAVEYRPESFSNDIDKLLNVFKGEIGAGKVFDNYQGNVERIYESYKKIIKMPKNIFEKLISSKEEEGDAIGSSTGNSLEKETATKLSKKTDSGMENSTSSGIASTDIKRGGTNSSNSLKVKVVSGSSSTNQTSNTNSTNATIDSNSNIPEKEEEVSGSISGTDGNTKGKGEVDPRLEGVDKKLVELISKDREITNLELEIAKNEQLPDELKKALLELESKQQDKFLKLVKKINYKGLRGNDEREVIEKIAGMINKGKAEELKKFVGDINAATQEITGKINTVSEAAYAAVKKADSHTQDVFIKKWLGEDVEINDGNRADLVRKAVRKLSVANIKTGDGNDIKNLVYKGNIVKINSETGDLDVVKGNAVKEAAAVSERQLRENWADIEGAKHGLKPEEVGFAGDDAHLETKEGIKLTVGDKSVVLHQDDLERFDKLRESISSNNSNLSEKKMEFIKKIFINNKDSLDNNKVEKITQVLESANSEEKLNFIKKIFVDSKDNLNDDKIRKITQVLESANSEEKLNFISRHRELLENPAEAKYIFEIAEAGGGNLNLEDIYNYYQSYDAVKYAGSPSAQCGLIELFKDPNSQEGLELLLKDSGVNVGKGHIIQKITPKLKNDDVLVLHCEKKGWVGFNDIDVEINKGGAISIIRRWRRDYHFEPNKYPISKILKFIERWDKSKL